MTNIASTVFRAEAMHVVVTAHNSRPLGDAEWEDQYCAQIREVNEAAGTSGASNLVFAEGIGPTVKQRRTANAVVDGNEGYAMRVAVVTDSLAVRGVVTAFTWFNPLISAYAPSEYAWALTHARIQKHEFDALLGVMRELLARVPDAGVLAYVVRDFERKLASSGRRS